MKRLLLIPCCLAAVSAAAGVLYDFEVTTVYQFGGSAFGVAANPDTGFLTVVNNGPSTFVGQLSLSGVSGNGPYGHWPGDLGDTQNTGPGYTLAPGASVTFIASSEGSNYGGWNKQGGGLPDLGLKFEMSGTINGQAVDLSVHDSDIHSGTPRVSLASGVLTDAYVLQGSDPFGLDNGDAFEVSAAPGHYTFRGTVVPEPQEYAMLAGLGLAGLAAHRRWRRY